MSEPGFASLGPTLLARKGGAKPAMRPQVAPLVVDEAEIAALADEQLEDLGWNDMGDGETATDSEGSADVVVPINAAVAAADTAPVQSPIVHRQQRRLEERVLADAAMTGPEYAAKNTLGEGADEAGEADDFDYEAWTADDTDEAEEEAYADEYKAADYAPLVPAPAPVVVPAKARRALRPVARFAPSPRWPNAALPSRCGSIRNAISSCALPRPCRA